MYRIYKITNIISGKTYIGLTKRSIEKRLQTHFYEARVYKYNMYLHNAIRKHGYADFQISLIEECGEDRIHAGEREQFWIQHLNTLQPNGYNEHIGGLGGCTNATPELRKKLSDARHRYLKRGHALPKPERLIKLPAPPRIIRSKKIRTCLTCSSPPSTRSSRYCSSCRANAYKIRGEKQIGRPLAESTKKKLSDGAKGRVPWNVGISNPLSADNARRGAIKMSQIATGRKRQYNADGSWTWEYPKTKTDPLS